MTEFCTQVHGGKAYQITVKTDNKEHYLRIQQAARECVDNAPAVDDVSVVHGKWIKTVEMFDFDDFEEEAYSCSACNVCQKPYFVFRSKYCPNCGAKMDEVIG